MKTHRLQSFDTDRTGNCDQGRRCTCSKPDDIDMTRAESVRDAGHDAIRGAEDLLHDFLIGFAIVLAFLLALGFVGHMDLEDAQLEQQVANGVAR